MHAASRAPKLAPVAATRRRQDHAMEFHITTTHAAPLDLVVIDELVRAADPAALLDLDGHTLRVATSLDARQLTTLIGDAGYLPDDAQVMQLPSICCGGCSG